MERSRGIHGHNIVTAVMNEKALNVQDALDVVGEMFQDTARQYLNCLHNLPSFTPQTDKALARFGSDMGSWVRALHEWSFDSERYFGKNGAEVRLTRKITLTQPPNDRVPEPIPMIEVQEVTSSNPRSVFLALFDSFSSYFSSTLLRSRADTKEIQL